MSEQSERSPERQPPPPPPKNQDPKQEPPKVPRKRAEMREFHGSDDLRPPRRES